MVLVDDRLLQRAYTGGACKEALDMITVGQPLVQLPADYLGWLGHILDQAEIDAIASNISGVPCNGVDPYVLGCSGYSGAGDGAGYGYGNGYGYGAGDGDGDGIGYGDGYGNGYGAGYGDGYGDGYGYGILSRLFE